jgi:shikimate dehydrogenase
VSRPIDQHKVSSGSVFALRGSGGMAKAVACALRAAAFARGSRRFASAPGKAG